MQLAIQTEVDAAYLYNWLASKETNTTLAEIYKEMCAIENGHATSFIKNTNYTLPNPSFKAKTITTLGSILGTNFVLGILLNTEKQLANSITKARSNAADASVSDTAHVAILQNILNNNNAEPSSIATFEKKHRTIGANALRAAVLGGNDGLISNFCLIMGIAGATNNAHTILLTGMAGMLAGALSMAMGEWISVKSAQELYYNQLAVEEEELIINPAGEQKELELIYRAKGIAATEAAVIAKDLMQNRSKALQVLMTEEVGLSPEDNASPMQAALSSFIMFAIGAVIPIIPFFFAVGNVGIIASIICSIIGMFLIGMFISLFTNKPIWFTGARQIIFGVVAASITYSLGKLLGASL
jgi:vacuolar iron transporter family protein